MKELDQLSPDTRAHLATMVEAMLTPQRLSRLEEIMEQRTRHITVVLEDIYHPHNASACLRSCECFGVQDVHVLESASRFRPINDISVGSAQWLTLHKYHRTESDALPRMLTALDRRGYKLIATSPSPDAPTLAELKLDCPIAIAFGTEETGLSPELLAAADGRVRIPMQGFTQSFNVSVSVALCLYELTNRLRQMPIDWQLTSAEREELRLRWRIASVPNSHIVMRHLLERLQQAAPR